MRGLKVRWVARAHLSDNPWRCIGLSSALTDGWVAADDYKSAGARSLRHYYYIIISSIIISRLVPVRCGIIIILL